MNPQFKEFSASKLDRFEKFQVHGFMVLHSDASKFQSLHLIFICLSIGSSLLSIFLPFQAYPLFKAKSTSFTLSSLSEKLGLLKSWIPLNFWTKLFSSQLHEFKLGNLFGLCPQNSPALTSSWKTVA